MKLIINKSYDPYYNLALEEYVLKHYGQDDYIILWQNNNTIVVGKHQNTIEEINIDFVEKHQIQVVRRNTGGGAVYHDLGNINFSIITDVGEKSTLTMERFTRPIAKLLGQLGIKAEVSGRNDITIDGRKISGNAQQLYKNRILHHGTLLFDTNSEVMQQALQVRLEKFESKSTKSVRSRVGNIKDFLQIEMTVEDFIERLQQLFFEGQEKQLCALTQEDLQKINQLKIEKYSTWSWTFGESPRFNIKNQKKYQGGWVEVFLEVKQGRIESCKLYGDFMAMKDVEELVEQLIHKKYEYEEIKQVFQGNQLSHYIGSITDEELLDCFFH